MTLERDAPRYMIRFADGAAGRRFARMVREELVSGRNGALADALETFPDGLRGIRLVRFRLKDEWPDGAAAGAGAPLPEEDRKLQLATTKVYLPFSGGTALAFDPGKKIPWGVADIGAPRLWKKSRGRLVRIGVIDTGADFRHPDLRHALRKGVNILDHRLAADDDNGHGTHIAGTIAAGAAGAFRGIRGVAPAAEIHPVKAFDREGAAYVSDIVRAIDWCLANGMQIINMSFGMPDYSPSLHNAVREAWNRRVAVVASAGNSGKRSEVDFPARSAVAIAVGAVNRRGRIASFSNRGKEVDVYAPGEAIYSAWLKGRYNELNGTSMAAAHVSGTIALILARRRAMSPDAVRRAIVHSASPLTGPDNAADAAGRLNAVRAFECAMHRPDSRVSRKRPAGRRAAASGTAQSGASGRQPAVRARDFPNTAAFLRLTRPAANRCAHAAPHRRPMVAKVRRAAAPDDRRRTRPLRPAKALRRKPRRASRRLDGRRKRHRLAPHRLPRRTSGKRP